MNPNPWSKTPVRLLVGVSVLLMLTANASAEWKEKVLYSFQDGSDGNTPAGGVVFDKAGNLYGATSYNTSCGNLLDCGAVFQLSLQRGVWIETTLHDFQGHAQHDGGAPQGGVILDASGNVYGTTAYGGTGGCVLLGTTVGCGTVYELSPPTQKGGQWTYTVLYNFQGGKDGLFPWGNLVFDKYGNLYGATQFGGGKGTTCNQYFDGNCGTVFELSPPKQKGGAWKERILYGFAGVADGKQIGDGANPNGGLILDSARRIYGTTYFGGNNQPGICAGGAGGTGCGTVFELIPPAEKGGTWKEKLIYLFQGGKDASTPGGGVTFGIDGGLFGTTVFGPQDGWGTIFEVTKSSGKSGAWQERILYRFTNGQDGNTPQAGLISDVRGNLYGTARDGNPTWGTVFRIEPTKQSGSWTFALLYGFRGAPDGGNPAASLILDTDGNLYGTTLDGGTGVGPGCQSGCGTVFKVTP
jgi:hypothetical protein